MIRNTIFDGGKKTQLDILERLYKLFSVILLLNVECAFVTSGGTMGQVLLKRCLYVSTGEI